MRLRAFRLSAMIGKQIPPYLPHAQIDQRPSRMAACTNGGGSHFLRKKDNMSHATACLWLPYMASCKRIAVVFFAVINIICLLFFYCHVSSWTCTIRIDS
jgi:hypothetical protein